MPLVGRKTWLWPLVAVVVLVAAVGLYLGRTQREAADRVREAFRQRATLTADLTGTVLQGSRQLNQKFAGDNFAGDAQAVRAALDAYLPNDPGGYDFVLAADGTLLAADPVNRHASPTVLASAPEIRAARAGQAGFSNLVTMAGADRFVLTTPFDAPDGRRIWASSVLATDVAAFVKGYLASSLAVAGGKSALLDANGRVITAATDETVGRPPADPALAAAGDKAATGTVNGQFFVSSPVPGTPWRIVSTAPARALLEPVRSSSRAAWQLFVLFSIAMACMVAAGVAALTRSARLAHERLHDPLTGLPNRGLILDNVRRLLAGHRSAGRDVAVLFLDLDGFKPVNDVHGHAAGDELLRAVAQRLTEAIRPHDMAGRFGGDEFIVVCPQSVDDSDAVTVAGRIRAAIAEPFRINGVDVRIGTSIGVATAGQMPCPDAAALIHAADAAMYRAKNAGKGRIEQYDRMSMA